MFKIVLSIVCLLGSVTTFAESMINEFQNGDYGSQTKVCGVHLEKDLGAKVIYFEYIPNEVYPFEKCYDRGKITEFDCSGKECVGFFDERRMKFKLKLIPDGNFIRYQYNYDFKINRYVLKYTVKYRLIKN